MGKNRKKSKSNNPKTAQVKPVEKSKSLQSHPYWFAFGLAFVLMLIFFQPVMLSDQTFQSSDKMTSRSIQPFIRESLAEGTYPLWNPYIFSGMPSFASLSSAPYVDVVGDVINAGIWLIRRIIPLTDFTRLFINYLIMGGLVFLFMRMKKCSIVVSFFTGVAMMMLPEMVAYPSVGHNTKLATVVFFPLILISVENLLDRRNLLFFSITGLAIGLQLLRAHVQMCFYTYIMVGIYVIFWIVSQLKDKKPLGGIFSSIGLLGGAAILGLLVSSVLNLSVWEYSHYSIRGGGTSGGLDYGYATNWSFHPSEIVTFFVPSFMGFGGQTYWGFITSSDYPLYFGIVTLLLAGIALILNRNRMVWFLTLLAGFTLLLSFGKHFSLLYGLLFKTLPLFNKFRAPKMILIIFDFALVLLAGFGLEGLIRLTKDDLKKKAVPLNRYLLVFGVIVVLLFFILVVAKGAYFGWVTSSLQSRYPAANPMAFRQVAQQAFDMARQDGVKALFLFIFSGGAIWLALRNKLSMKTLSVVMCLILVIDLWGVGKKIIDPKPKMSEQSYFNETPEVTYLKNQKEPFRIMTVFDAYQRQANWYMYHKIQDVYGYSAAKLRIYQELMEAFNMPERYGYKYLKTVDGKTALKSPEEVNLREKHIHDTFLKMLNVKFIVSQVPLPDTSLQMVLPPQVRNGNVVLEFKDALPRVFFPQEFVKAEGKEGILNYMTSSRFDPTVTSVLEMDPPFEIQYSDSNHAEIVKYEIHKIQVNADIQTSCQMVLSEIYYPAGWKAYVDGNETTIYKTDYVLRSIFLEPGRHYIEFRFKPASFSKGLLISIATLTLLIAGVLLGIRVERKKQSNVMHT